MEGRDNTTRPGERASTFIVLSGEVSDDACGNGQLHQIDKSRQLQRKLYLAAKKCRERRFHALYDRILRPDVLWRAWQEVKANGGSAGVDGVSLEEVERQGVAPFLEVIAADLKAGRYQPQPVLRV